MVLYKYKGTEGKLAPTEVHVLKAENFRPPHPSYFLNICAILNEGGLTISCFTSKMTPKHMLLLTYKEPVVGITTSIKFTRTYRTIPVVYLIICSV